MKNLVLAGLLGLSFLNSNQSFAVDANDFSDMNGWYIAASTSVDGSFEGCDYDKKIVLLNGWILTCNTYHYHYSYSPKTIIFVRDISSKGISGYAVKALIDDHLYDMGPILKR